MAITIEKISKRVEDRWLLRDVNLTAERGEMFGIAGLDKESQASLLRIIAGEENANQGRILINNEHLNQDQVVKLNKPENPTGLKSLFSSSAKENKNLFDIFNEKLHEAHNVLLIDHSLNCLSQNEKSDFLAQLRKITKQNNLIVILTADSDEVIFSCDKVGVLEKGEIIQCGNPREIYESPDSFAAAAALGRNNFIEARRLSSSKSDVPEFQTLKGEHRLFTSKPEKQRLGAINQNVTLSIRPEHISISFGASFPEDNLIKAKISEINFLGATTSIKLDAEGLELEALVLRLVGLNVGDECMVGLPPDRILILKQ